MEATGMTWRKSTYSLNNGDCVEVADWRKSTRSTTGDTCVETANGNGLVMVRDTTNRDGQVLSFDAAAWSAFIKAL